MEDRIRKTLPAGSVPPEIPGYMKDVYFDAYLNPAKVKMQDSSSVANLRVFGNMNKLIAAAMEEAKSGQKVLQAGAVYGRFLLKMAMHIGTRGKYDILDIAPPQVDRWESKMAGFPQAELYHADAEIPVGGRYDVVQCFFLLHEVPDAKKKRIVNNLLNMTDINGKTVFIDYSKPRKFHPFNRLVLFLNRIREPFAETMWNVSIQDMADDAKSFKWTRKTYFGGLYQKVVAERVVGGREEITSGVKKARKAVKAKKAKRTAPQKG